MERFLECRLARNIKQLQLEKCLGEFPAGKRMEILPGTGCMLWPEAELDKNSHRRKNVWAGSVQGFFTVKGYSSVGGRIGIGEIWYGQ